MDNSVAFQIVLKDGKYAGRVYAVTNCIKRAYALRGEAIQRRLGRVYIDRTTEKAVNEIPTDLFFFRERRKAAA